ncbi:unnamed protein product [Owenia fusiformis]|uniref:RRM domain-containing protein n=1 Tax=Owenia fusiformis TaxID=6347 RepID=A0A8S4NW20_OWEFU|nr:unnamed protein product [Owenia fusiformis]
MADTLTLQRLFIGGLYPDITSSQLEARFKMFGDIKSVSIQSKKGETPDQNKTFAYINLKTTDGNIKKCMSSYNNTKWKGNVMKIQIAKENFLDRLKQEREENNKVLKEPLEKTPDSDFKIKDFTVKGAKPGTPTDQEHWVIGKYGRVLPVLELKRRDRKKVVEIDPSKLCHAIKQFKEEDIEQGGVSEMTWQLEDKDSPMTKKRKGEFPKIKKQKKRKNQVVVDAQKTPESNNLSSTPSEKITTKVTATSSGLNSLTNLKNIKTKQLVETEIVPRLSEFEIVSLQEDLDKTAKKNVVEQVGKQKKGRNSERDSTGSADTDQVILKMKKKTRKRSDSTSSLTIPVGGPQPAKKKVKTQNEKNTIKSSEKQSQQTNLNILKWNTVDEFKSGIVDDVPHQRRTWQPRTYNSDSEDDFEKIIKGKIKIEDIENKMRKTVREDDSTNDNESSKLKSENEIEYHSSSESEQDNTERNNESNLKIGNKSRAHKKSTNEIVKPADQENLTKSSDEDTPLSEESIGENASSASGSDEANVNDNSGNLKTESAMEESEPPNEDEISVDSNVEDESSVDSNSSGNESDEEFEESDDESNDSASELVSESENDSGESEEESSESDNENSQPIKTETPQMKTKKVHENLASNKVITQLEEEDSGSDFEMFETAAMTTSKKKMSTEKMKEFVRNRKECEKLESSSDDSDSEVEMKNEIKPEVATEGMRKESKIETKPKIETELMKIESKSEANIKTVDGSKTKVPKITTNQTAEEKHALANQKRLDALKQKHKEMKEQQSAMKIALTSLDKQTSKAQHTKFDSDDDDDDDVTVQATAVKEADSGKSLDDPNVVKPKSKLSKEKKSLFDSDSESDSSDKEDAEMFKIRPEYEGEAGKKLIKLQSRFGNDSRFKLDERFIESDEDGDEGKLQDVAMETHDDNIDGKSEKERALEILSSVVGHVKVDRNTKSSLSSFSAPRFDPTKEEHQKFEIKRDVTTSKSKAARAKDKAALEAATEPEEEETLPEVSTEKYFEVQDNLKESIQQGQNTPFSFLSAFSSGGDAGDKDDEGNVTAASDSLMKDSSSTAEVESRQSGTTASTMLPWQSNPFSYDSSSDEDEDDATSANKVGDEQETKTESKTTTMTTTFFYFENDERLQDCHSYFHPVEDKDALKENWLEKRPDRVEAYRTRHKRAVRQVRVTRGRENQRGRGRGRGRGTPSRRSF